VLDAQTTEVRAMIGSTGWDRPGGQINITTRRRHPGSALKPFVYATAIERGANPATIAWDPRHHDAYFSPTAVEHGPVATARRSRAVQLAAVDAAGGGAARDDRAAQGGVAEPLARRTTMACGSRSAPRRSGS
jgi:hypothetical protein